MFSLYIKEWISMKKTMLLLMIVISVGTFARDRDRDSSEREARLELYRAERAEARERMSRENKEVPLDLEVKEVVEKNLERDFYNRGRERD